MSHQSCQHFPALDGRELSRALVESLLVPGRRSLLLLLMKLREHTVPLLFQALALIGGLLEIESRQSAQVCVSFELPLICITCQEFGCKSSECCTCSEALLLRHVALILHNESAESCLDEQSVIIVLLQKALGHPAPFAMELHSP